MIDEAKSFEEKHNKVFRRNFVLQRNDNLQIPNYLVTVHASFPRNFTDYLENTAVYELCDKTPNLNIYHLKLFPQITIY